MTMQQTVFLPQNYQKTVAETGLETYLAHMCLYPVHINVKRFSTLHHPMPPDMFMAHIAQKVKDTSLKNAKIHLASAGWKGVNALDGTAKDKTMVICGSGRSIVNNVKELQRLKSDKMVVVAINGALKAMPPGTVDIYFTLDWLSNRAWWAEIDPVALHPGIKAVLGLPAPGELATVFPERYYFPANYVVADPPKAEEFAQKHGFLAECEMATHSAMHLAYRMGCSKVILLGHDFACTDGFYHWDERLHVSHATSQEFKVEADIFGYGTITSDNLKKNCAIVNCTAQACAEDGMITINSSEAGILGMALSMPLAQALAYSEAKPCLPLSAA